MLETYIFAAFSQLLPLALSLFGARAVFIYLSIISLGTAALCRCLMGNGIVTDDMKKTPANGRQTHNILTATYKNKVTHVQVIKN